MDDYPVLKFFRGGLPFLDSSFPFQNLSLEMLKVVNDLNYTYEYSDEIVKGSREYFEKGDHTTIPILPEHKKRIIICNGFLKYG